MSMLDMLTSRSGGNGADDGGGIMGFIKQFKDAIAETKVAANASMELQQAILHELQEINGQLTALRLERNAINGRTDAPGNPAGYFACPAVTPGAGPD